MLTSRVIRANANVKSVKCTIPVEVAEVLGLEPGDVIAWDLGKKTACIRKLE